jgi:ribonuclease BN (tRNA processing enzyme)
MNSAGEDLRLTIIGAGSPHPSAERFGSSVIVEDGDGAVMVDCGPGTAYKMVGAGIHPTRIEGLMYTHHHFDHTAGTPSVALTRWEGTVTGHTPLQVVGPRGTSRFLDALVGPDGAFRPDIRARREAPLSQQKFQGLGGALPRPDLEYEVVELEAGQAASIHDRWQIRTGRAYHVQPYHESIAYRIEAHGRSIVVTGDTEYCPDLDELSQGADVLIAMCVGTAEHFSSSALQSGQMGTREVNRVARAAGVSNVILTHTGLSFAHQPQRGRGLREVGEGFAGEVIFADEGLSLSVEVGGRVSPWSGWTSGDHD